MDDEAKEKATFFESKGFKYLSEDILGTLFLIMLCISTTPLSSFD